MNLPGTSATERCWVWCRTASSSNAARVADDDDDAPDAEPDAAALSWHVTPIALHASASPTASPVARLARSSSR